ncbi:MAG: glutaredoxin [Deltaproteobacteria bacterium HGW-Deltaproteobacteria-15]|jgi:glutaredoxin|nr:MAG: glutaredoxin [Deltaproteobacteria bacterium HGW-Deltaproteobacteria-15]
MEKKRRIEVFTAGCPVCEGVVDMVKELSCQHCELTFYDLHNHEGMDQAKTYGVTAVPAVAVNGNLLECCRHRPITREDLKSAGLGEPL